MRGCIRLFGFEIVYVFAIYLQLVVKGPSFSYYMGLGSFVVVWLRVWTVSLVVALLMGLATLEAFTIC